MDAFRGVILLCALGILVLSPQLGSAAPTPAEMAYKGESSGLNFDQFETASRQKRSPKALGLDDVVTKLNDSASKVMTKGRSAVSMAKDAAGQVKSLAGSSVDGVKQRIDSNVGGGEGGGVFKLLG